MSSRLLLAVVLATFAATSATAAPTARFTARPIQGPTCVAPCAVHFDAIGDGSDETTDPAFTRPFHSLLYQWDFGDPTSGIWAVSGVSKNSAVGGIAGHVYDNPGSYLVTLSVTNPSGEVSMTTRSVTVVDAASVFSAANTFCFANSASNWAGCPLNCAGGDDNCTVTSDWSALITQGDNCSGSGDCSNADAGPRRILLRRGDTFSAATQIIFSGSATSPGIISAFGTGADPIIANAGRNDWGTGWTVTGVELRSNQTILATNTTDNLTFYRVNAQFSGTCIDEPPVNLQLPGTTRVGQLHAYVEVNCTATGPTGYANWPGANYVMWMGGTINKNGGSDSTLRAHHMQHYLIEHTRWINAPRGREHWQFRAYDEFANFSPAEEANRFVLLSDNVVENPGSNGFFSVRVCVDSGCNCGEGAAQCGGAGIGAGKIVNVADFVFERNFFKYSTDGTGARLGVFELQGGDFTVRNNIVDYQGAFGNYDSSFVVATGEPTQHTSGSSGHSNFHVDNNTVYFTNPYSSHFNFANTRGSLGSGCVGGCFSRNNLLVAPGFSGTLQDHPSFVRSNNVAVGSGNPFVGTVPGQGATTKSSFQLGVSAPGVADAGATFVPTTTRDGWVFDDAFGNCRSTPSTGPWDVGASERGGVRCATSSQPPPTALLPPILLAPQ